MPHQNPNVDEKTNEGELVEAHNQLSQMLSQNQEGFRTTNISSGWMKLKREEFLEFRQGDQNVVEYMNEFNNLARYAPEEIDTDVKKKNRLSNGLDDELSILTTIAYTPDYQSLVDQAIILEGKLKQIAKERQKHELDHQIHNVKPTPTDMGNQESKGSTWIKPAACKTCGEIGHTSNECHDEWPHGAARHQIKGVSQAKFLAFCVKQQTIFQHNASSIP